MFVLVGKIIYKFFFLSSLHLTVPHCMHTHHKCQLVRSRTYKSVSIIICLCSSPFYNNSFIKYDALFYVWWAHVLWIQLPKAPGQSQSVPVAVWASFLFFEQFFRTSGRFTVPFIFALTRTDAFVIDRELCQCITYTYFKILTTFYRILWYNIYHWLSFVKDI